MKCSSGFSSTSSSPAIFGFTKSAAQAFVAAMGCIFSCFRVKHGSSPSELKDSATEEAEVNRSRSSLSALFESEVNACSANMEQGLQGKGLETEELKNRTKFFKACGDIPEATAETGKNSGGKNDRSSSKGGVESLKFKSWLTYTSVEKLDLENQPEQLENLDKDCDERVDHDTNSRRDTTERVPNSNGAMPDGDIFTDHPNCQSQDSFKKVDESENVKTGETSVDKDLIQESSMDTYSVTKNVHRVINPSERPIIGLVAAHWNDNDPTRVSPKWWDGNGIPNSTNKYQEDQKVSWHATPFEERLEKALSEETLISQRKQSTVTLNSGETEESDTAISQLQSSTGSKPVGFRFDDGT